MVIWLLLALLLCCSGAVSASETALFSLTRRELHQFGRSSARAGRRVQSLMATPRRVLMAVLLANTAVNVAIFAVSFVALQRLQQRPVLAALGGIGVLLAVIVFGEMLPKGVALAGRVRLAPSAGAAIAVLQTVLAPLRWVLAAFLIDPITRLLAPAATPSDAVTTEELRLLVEQSAQDGAIDSKENEMLRAIVALAQASVREVMMPRVDLHSIGIDDDPVTARSKLRASGRRRLPVCGRNLDDVRGVLNARDAHLHPQAAVQRLMRPVHFIPEQANLLQALRHLREQGMRMAIVVDEYGGTAGLVSIQDVAEHIVGDLPEDAEDARAPSTIERIDDDTYRLAGNASVRLWAERFGVGAMDRQIDTLAGLVLLKLGRLPQPGDCVRIRNLTLTVETMDHRRIETVLVRRDADADRGQEDPR